MLFIVGTFESSPLASKDLPKAVLESLVSDDDLKKLFKQPGGSQNASNVNVMTAITMAALKIVENNTPVAYYPPSPSGMSE